MFHCFIDQQFLNTGCGTRLGWTMVGNFTCLSTCRRCFLTTDTICKGNHVSKLSQQRWGVDLFVPKMKCFGRVTQMLCDDQLNKLQQWLLLLYTAILHFLCSNFTTMSLVWRLSGFFPPRRCTQWKVMFLTVSVGSFRCFVRKSITVFSRSSSTCSTSTSFSAAKETTFCTKHCLHKCTFRLWLEAGLRHRGWRQIVF